MYILSFIRSRNYQFTPLIIILYHYLSLFINNQSVVSKHYSLHVSVTFSVNTNWTICHSHSHVIVPILIPMNSIKAIPVPILSPIPIGIPIHMHTSNHNPSAPTSNFLQFGARFHFGFSRTARALN